MIEFLLLFTGLALLYKSSSIVIGRAARLSELTGISQLAIGFVFVAVATSLPELTVAVMSSFLDKGNMGFGVLAGSNIVNITLVFGAMAIAGLKMKKEDFVSVDEAVIFTTAIAFFVLILGKTDFVFGIFSLILFYIFFRSVSRKSMGTGSSKGLKTIETVKSIIYILAAIAVVIISARIVVDSAVDIATLLGITEAVIGALIISMGTALPELSIGILAIRKGNPGLAIGDSIGSLAVNMTLILGLVSIINPVTIDFASMFVFGFLILANLLFLFIVSRARLGIFEGMILILTYIMFLFSTLMVFA